MFNWYNKTASKSTITGYLSHKYTQEQLSKLTYLELPNNFENSEYTEELNLILQGSPWKVNEIKYTKSFFTAAKDYWFGKKRSEPVIETPPLSPLTEYADDNPFDVLNNVQDSDNISLNSESTNDNETTYQTTNKPTKTFWNNNRNLLMIAGLIVLAVIIYQNN
jgi:hypothetical protein